MVDQDLDGGHRHLRGVERGLGMAAEAVEHGLDEDLADALERAREGGVHSHKFTLWHGLRCGTRGIRGRIARALGSALR